MVGVYALYSEVGAAQRALARLHASGVAPAKILLISAEPITGGMLPVAGPRVSMWVAAAAGGLCGAVAGALLTSLTQSSWPIVTANMPIVPAWTNLIVVFELAMLGAIVATVVTFAIGAGLGGRRSRLYDAAVSEGRILVGVERPAFDKVPTIHRALSLDGTVEVKTT